MVIIIINNAETFNQISASLHSKKRTYGKMSYLNAPFECSDFIFHRTKDFISSKNYLGTAIKRNKFTLQNIGPMHTGGDSR
jgi:hypothetical protein